MVYAFAEKYGILSDPFEYIVLDWMNNFVSIKGFASYYDMSDDDALCLIMLAKRELERRG